MTEHHDEENQREPEERFHFTDRRKVDPETGEARPSGGAPTGAAPGEPASAGAGSPEGTPTDGRPADDAENAGADLDAEAAKLVEDDRAALEAKVAELTDELQRERAEYVNSRRRIEATAKLESERAVARVVESLIPVLDDIHGARTAGDLEEGTPFAAVSTKLEELLGSHGVTRFGEVGEEFDPNRHEALMHTESEDAETTTVTHLLQPGYMIGDKVIRPARVATQGPA